MTHDTRFSVRLLGHPSFLSAAVVYDFIPLDWPGYLPTTPMRIEYVAKIARLRQFDVFLPISEYTSWRLSDLVGVSRRYVHVTGASVRQSLYSCRKNNANEHPASPNDPYFVIVVAMDPRKNAELAVKAVRQLNSLHSRRARLKVAGHYREPFKKYLLNLAGHPEGEGFLEFACEIPDDELMRLYAGAVATIVPSHIEGFSLPIVEAALSGCPALASTCAAHLELIDQPEALFPSHDVMALSERLEALLAQPSLRTSLVSKQAHLADKFNETLVGARFWSGIEASVCRTWPPAAAVKRKSRIAFISPFPPDPSDAASYTAKTMEASVTIFDSDLYTDSPRPLHLQQDFYNASEISIAPLIDKRYNGVVSVLGNSASNNAFELFEYYGGPCILHDLRLVEAYRRRLSSDDLLAFASSVLGRNARAQDLDVPPQDVESSLLLVERIISRASPLIVNTRAQQQILQTRYNVQVHVATCCPSLTLTDTESSVEFALAARERLGIPRTSFLIATFGGTVANGNDLMVMAIDFLRTWNIPAELILAGGQGDQLSQIFELADVFGVRNQVHGGPEFDSDYVRRQLLSAADAAVQLRSYEFGKASTELCNWISAGVPSVATADMMRACDGPSYVRPVPDYFSPLHVAEQLALIWEAKRDRSSYEEERADYKGVHKFTYYSSRLLEILGLA